MEGKEGEGGKREGGIKRTDKIQTTKKYVLKCNGIVKKLSTTLKLIIKVLTYVV